MEDDSDSSGDTSRDADQITCSYDKSIDDIMHKISYEIHDSKAMDMSFGDRHMTVIPVKNFFCDESKKNSTQDPKGGS